MVNICCLSGLRTVGCYDAHISNNSNNVINDCQTICKEKTLNGISRVEKVKGICDVCNYELNGHNVIVVEWQQCVVVRRTSAHSLDKSLSLVKHCWKVPPSRCCKTRPLTEQKCPLRNVSKPRKTSEVVVELQLLKAAVANGIWRLETRPEAEPELKINWTFRYRHLLARSKTSHNTQVLF